MKPRAKKSGRIGKPKRKMTYVEQLSADALWENVKKLENAVRDASPGARKLLKPALRLERRRLNQFRRNPSGKVPKNKMLKSVRKP